MSKRECSYFRINHRSPSSLPSSHWYYEDFIREQNPSKFPSYSLKSFSEALFHACPLLAHLADDHDKSFSSFMKYKTRVPVCGAIMLNDAWDKVVSLSCGNELNAYVRATAVRTGQGLEILSRMGFSKREDQRARAKASMCYPRGVYATHARGSSLTQTPHRL